MTPKVGRQKRPPAQLELFGAAVDAAGGLTAEDIHALGLLGYKDPLWTRRLDIPLLGGKELSLRLVDIRALVRWPTK